MYYLLLRVVRHSHTRNWHRPGSLVVFGGTLSRRQGGLLLFCLVFCFFFQLSCRFLVFASRSTHISHSHLVDLSHGHRWGWHWHVGRRNRCWWFNGFFSQMFSFSVKWGISCIFSWRKFMPIINFSSKLKF